jgi:hypothetical protein
MGGEYIIDTWLDWFFSDEYEEESEEENGTNETDI